MWVAFTFAKATHIFSAKLVAFFFFFFMLMFMFMFFFSDVSYDVRGALWRVNNKIKRKFTLRALHSWKYWCFHYTRWKYLWYSQRKSKYPLCTCVVNVPEYDSLRETGRQMIPTPFWNGFVPLKLGANSFLLE